ncbi:glycosyltransferase [Acinetobacter towneri]|uniref:glycosyltransferase n=1 Tax=Acinetobacter towneri TaxID=202956 RepID=UPI002934ED9A|nr:glycosyltransferase [Acinetobacter towneri]WOE28756.1 glycosyltransferase [Acinetobacter towneri]
MKSNFYICNNFGGNKVHSETILNLAQKYSDVNHYVFVPYNNKITLEKNFINSENLFVYYIYFYKFLKFFPLFKSFFIFFKILFKCKRDNIEWGNGKILAYTFWSDGIIALYFNLIFSTPFSVFVRVTDLSIFFKYGYHLRPLLYLIGKRSEYIYFPSLALKKNYLKYSFLNKSINKLCFMPNSLNDFWLNNIFHFNNLIKVNKKILFVGSFDENKNLNQVFKACLSLHDSRKDFKLEFVGGSLNNIKTLCGINSIPDWVSITEKINNKEDLLLKYRESNILLVPSFLETLGMVYLEAISQGCFVIHSKNQGIDYLFNDGFSYAVDPTNTQEISCLLDKLLDKDFQLDSSSLKEKLNLFSSVNVINLYSRFFD